MRCDLFRSFFIVVFLSLPSIVFSIECSNCGNALCCCRPGQVYCNHCSRELFPDDLFPDDLFPDDLFRQHRRLSAAFGEELVIRQAGSHLDATNQIMLHTANLSPFNPTQIISNQNLDSLLSYLNCHYHGIRPNPYIVFSSVSLAQLLILNVPALSNLDEAGQQVALWWLTGYWLLYISPAARGEAQHFLSLAPDSLQLNAAQTQIHSLQSTATRILQLPDVISLFHARNQPGHQYTFSAAQSLLNSLSANSPYLAQVTYPGGIIAIIHLAGTYYIITPYNQLFSAASLPTALQILSQIATAQYLPRRILTAATETAILSTIGAGVGAITGLPILVGLSLLERASSHQALSAYWIWITMAIAIANLSYNRLGASKEIHDDLTEPPQDNHTD